MNIEADAANQIISMSLEGAKFTAKAAGKVGKEAIVMTFAIIKSIVKKHKEKKALTGGEKKFIDMVMSGKPFDEYVVPFDKFEDLKNECKKRNISFAAYKDNEKNRVIITVYQQDSVRINRIIEELGINDVNVVNVTQEPTQELDNSDNITSQSAEDLYEALNDEDVVEENNHPFTDGVEQKKVQSENSSENLDIDTTTEVKATPDNKEFNNNPEKRPSVKKRLNDIIEQQVKEKAKDVNKNIQNAVSEKLKNTVQK